MTKHQGHDHHGDGTFRSSFSLGVVFFLNLFFAVLELFASSWTNSVAIFSDAIHDFGDSIILGINFLLLLISKIDRSEKATFGYARYRLLGSLATGQILLAGSIWVIAESIPRIFEPQPVDATGMLWWSLAGATINGFGILFLLKGNGETDSILTWHLLEDVLGWLSVAIVAIVIHFKPLYILDPILSILIALFIIKNIWVQITRTGKVFLEYAPDGVDSQDLIFDLKSHPLVSDIHDVHAWSLDGRYHLFSAHVLLEERALIHWETIKKNLKDCLKKHGFHHATLEVETPDGYCQSCKSTHTVSPSTKN